MCFSYKQIEWRISIKKSTPGAIKFGMDYTMWFCIDSTYAFKRQGSLKPIIDYWTLIISPK